MRAVLAVAQSLGDPDPTLAASGDGEHVLLDIDLEGARYVLIKMPQADRKSLPLSPREREIVRMVAQGHQNKIIAVVLNISAWTVCTHLRRIFAKLGVTSRAAMVARLVEFGGIAEQTNGVDQASVGPAAEPSAGARPRRTDALPWSPHRMARPSSVTEDIAPVPRAGVIARPSASRLGADDRVSAETGSRKSL